MKKIVFALSSILYITNVAHTALDDILIPKVTWTELLHSYEEQDSGRLIKDEILNLIHKAEKKYGIPHGLLAAIAYTESGRYMPNIKKNVIWPWTINANGRSYYLDNKEEAIRTVQKLQKLGMKFIDIGCMQVNLAYHGQAFKSLDEAFHPKHNVEYAAKLLKSLHDQAKSWDKAVCYYHSKTKEKYSKYYCKIMSKYKNLSKVQPVSPVPVYTLCKNNQVAHTMRKTIDDVIAERLHKLGKSILAQKTDTSIYSH